MMVASQIFGTDLPSFEEFIENETKPQNTRTAHEIENDFEEIIKKARESQNGVNL